MVFIFDLIFICIILLFLLSITFFLYKGASIYELITQSNSYDIYDKINKDIEFQLNKILIFNFALNNDYIYDISTNIKSNSLMNSLYFSNNTDNPILFLDVDDSKLVALLGKSKISFEYNDLKF